MQSRKGSFFERLARRCAQRPWLVIIIWVMLFAVGATLFATVFSRNMTTVTEFTTDTDSKKADDLFKERFHQAAYKVENAVITSDTYTADDRGVLGLRRWPVCKTAAPHGFGSSQERAVLRPGTPRGAAANAGMLQQMVDAMELALDEESTTAELAQAADNLQASAAHIRDVANGLTHNLTASGATARDGMLQAADGAEELAGSLLLGDALQKLHDALAPIAAGEAVSDAVLRATVTDLRGTAPTLRTAATALEATGPGSSARPVLISGLRDTANGLEEIGRALLAKRWHHQDKQRPETYS